MIAPGTQLASRVRGLARLGQMPAVLAPLVVLATWPTWHWYVARMTDGSDEPLGVLALVTAGALVPRRGWMEPSPTGALTSTGCALALYAVGFGHVPALVRAAWAVAALACVLPHAAGRPRLPRLAMLLLSLPLIASLQFYLGFPLRAMTSWLAAQVLAAAGLGVEAHGTVLRWAGEEILVDAPCSGIRMLWTACYVSTTLAGMFRLSDRSYLRLMHLTAGAVFAANLARTLLLFFIESGLWPGLRWAHETIGVVLFAGVVALCAHQARRWRADAPTNERPPVAPDLASRPRSRQAAALLLAAAAISASLPLVARTARNPEIAGRAAVAQPWPETFEGAPLQPAPLLPVEARMAAGFPGAVAAFDDSVRRIVVRQITQATRQVHPVATCLRAGGFAVTPRPAFRHPETGLWGVVAAEKDGQTYRVREHIVAVHGDATWTDVSSWFWSALAHPQQGPWLAVTVIEPARPRLTPAPSRPGSDRSP